MGRALEEHRHIKAFFWDYSSLHQKSASGDRTLEENEAFGRSR